MVNKVEGVFTEADEEAFEVFSVYCGLALHNAKVCIMSKTERRIIVHLDL